MLTRGRRVPARITSLQAQLRRTLIAQPVPPLVATTPLATTHSHGSEEGQANLESMKKYVEDFRKLREKASEGGGKATLEKWRKRGKGKLGARER
jgi:3-methylcrotonyl-CoA carboxylase beta subunit